MNILRKFLSKQTSQNSTSGQPTGEIPIDGVKFPIVSNPTQLSQIVERQQVGALRLRTLAYSSQVSEIKNAFRVKFGETSAQFKQLSKGELHCAGCLWEFPTSLMFTLAFGPAKGYIGVAAGTNPVEFGKTGKCPQCGSSESLFVYQYIDPEKITLADVDLIRNYWRMLAQQFWTQDKRKGAICDHCNKDIAQGEGFLYGGTQLFCANCTVDILKNALEQLRSDPYYFGTATLRKARASKL